MNNKERDRILSKYNHIFKSEKKYYSKMKPLPGKIINLEEQSFFRLVNVKFKKMIGNVKGKKILDVGCGRGDLSLYLAQQGANVIGIDLSNNHIDLCKTRANDLNLKVNFMVMNAQVPDFEDNVFDIIVGSRIIHHLPDIELFTRECKRLLTDVMIAQKTFGNMEHSEYFLISPLAVFFKNFIKKPILFRILYKILNKIESPLSKINYLKQYCWQIVFKCKKNLIDETLK